MPSLPTLNAFLNFCSAFFLVAGFIAIKKNRIPAHRNWMRAALLSSSLFLTSYLVYHFKVGSVPYPHHDWTRPLYFSILIPHVSLAIAMVPFIIVGVYYAINDRREAHKKIMRWVWPVWLFVSVSGLVVYGMLYLG